MKYLILVLTIGAFAFNSSAQTKAKPVAKKGQQIKKDDSKKTTKKAKPKTAAKSNDSVQPKSTAIRKRPGRIKVAPKKKD